MAMAAVRVTSTVPVLQWQLKPASAMDHQARMEFTRLQRGSTSLDTFRPLLCRDLASTKWGGGGGGGGGGVQHLQQRSCNNNGSVRRKQQQQTTMTRVAANNANPTRPSSQPRFIQHKQEAFWFYRFLSIVYDHVINPGHWTEDMREEALEPADLNDPDLVVVDVGGGTGFTTLGIVKTVDAKNVTILDQSPHQLAKAKEKEALQECNKIEGDAEDLPFETDYADRYISAGRYVGMEPISLSMSTEVFSESMLPSFSR